MNGTNSATNNTIYHSNFSWPEDGRVPYRTWNTAMDDNLEDLPRRCVYIFSWVQRSSSLIYIYFFVLVRSFPRFYNNNYNYHRNHLSALIPFGILFVISTIIFIMIIFRRWPGLVSGIIAGSFTFISIYLLLLTLKEEVLVYEWCLSINHLNNDLCSHRVSLNIHLFTYTVFYKKIDQ